MTSFTVAPLDSAAMADAYPMVRAAAPEVEAEQWQRYAEWLRNAQGGVLGAFAPNARLHGVAAYCRDDELRHGRALRVDLIVTFELSRSAPVRRALCDALEGLAREKRCDRLTLALPSRGFADAASAKAESWSELGFEMDSVTLSKRLDCGAFATALRFAR